MIWVKAGFRRPAILPQDFLETAMLPTPTRHDPHRLLRITILVLCAIALLGFLIRTAAM